MNGEAEPATAPRATVTMGRTPAWRACELSTAAFQLAARLEAYEADLEALARGGFDPARYRLLVHQLRDIGASTMALPALAADLMQITIQHFELIRLLCRPRAASASVRDQAQAVLLRNQCEAVRAVRDKCVRLIRRDHARRRLAAFTRR
jgi:hypothetical protein